MLKERATHPAQPGHEEGTGGNSVEAGIMELLERMLSGRFKVFEHLGDFFEELRMYHRENGKVVKVDDDLLDAVRTGMMMLRHAKTAPRKNTQVVEAWVPADPGAAY
jgi:hypothetical protein